MGDQQRPGNETKFHYYQMLDVCGGKGGRGTRAHTHARARAHAHTHVCTHCLGNVVVFNPYRDLLSPTIA